jgi:hypothetical protein
MPTFRAVPRLDANDAQLLCVMSWQCIIIGQRRRLTVWVIGPPSCGLARTGGRRSAPQALSSKAVRARPRAVCSVAGPLHRCTGSKCRGGHPLPTAAIARDAHRTDAPLHGALLPPAWTLRMKCARVPRTDDSSCRGGRTQQSPRVTRVLDAHEPRVTPTPSKPTMPRQEQERPDPNMPGLMEAHAAPPRHCASGPAPWLHEASRSRHAQAQAGWLRRGTLVRPLTVSAAGWLSFRRGAEGVARMVSSSACGRRGFLLIGREVPAVACLEEARNMCHAEST